jgi:hypothetical protein
VLTVDPSLPNIVLKCIVLVFLLIFNVILLSYICSVTCQPIVGLRNRALLGSRPLNASRPNTRYAAIGEAVFTPCRAVPSRTAPCVATQHVAMTSPGNRSRGVSRDLRVSASDATQLSPGSQQ